MSSTRRTLCTSTAAAAAGAVVAAAVLWGQPALAEHVDATAHAGQAAKGRHQVTSRDIKNSTIKRRDLRPGVRERIELAATALQLLPTNSVTRDKVADNAVGSAEVVNNSLVASDLAAGSVGANEINAGAVGTGQVKDGSLTSADVTSVHGVAVVPVPATVPARSCVSDSLNTGKVLDNDLVLAGQPVGLDELLDVSARPSAVGSTTLSISVCNPTGGPVTTGVTAVSVPYAVIEN